MVSQFQPINVLSALETTIMSSSMQMNNNRKMKSSSALPSGMSEPKTNQFAHQVPVHKPVQHVIKPKPYKPDLTPCYNFFPLPRLFPHLRSTTSLLLFCSFLPRDRSVLTSSPVLFLSSCTPSLVLPCSTGLSHSLVTSLTVTMFPLTSTQFYGFPLR